MAAPTALLKMGTAMHTAVHPPMTCSKIRQGRSSLQELSCCAGHPDGEAAVARGCQMMGVGNCLSTTGERPVESPQALPFCGGLRWRCAIVLDRVGLSASLSIEDVAAASPECYRWFQLYVYKDHEKTKRLVQRAEAAGYSAICLTVDLPVLGNRTSLKRIGFKVSHGLQLQSLLRNPGEPWPTAAIPIEKPW